MRPASPKVGFVSLGCPKATVDSERILTQLRAEGYEMVSSFRDADLVVVNTCGFIDAAVDESLETIGEALTENGRVIVTGCLGARQDVVRANHPQVLAVTGPNQLDEVISAIHAHLPPSHDPFTDLVPPGGIKLTPRHYAYVKIAEGCNQSCTFCIIPSMRGTLASRPVEQVLAEADKLVSAGVQELLIVSQDTGAYGVDTRYRTGFWNGRPVRGRITDLARQLGTLGAWVRLHYIYPYPHVGELLPLMADGLILPYLDVPLQHASPGILKAMRRPGDMEEMLKRIAQWRSDCPDLTLRSTFIVGFPGETEEDFEHLLEFLAEARLDRVGAFTYSPVEGAAANALPGAVAEELKEERLERFMELQAAISADRLQEKLESEQIVLVDEVLEDGIVARTKGDAPEIDGVVFIQTDAEISPGEKVRVRIVSADEHDLYGELI